MMYAVKKEVGERASSLSERVPYFQTSERNEQIHLFISERVQKESFLQGIRREIRAETLALGKPKR